MPEYIYRAMDQNGTIVRNRVEETSKQNLIKRLKGNNLLPINVTQVGYNRSKKKANRKNDVDIEDIMKNANSASVIQGRRNKRISTVEKFNLAISRQQKITTRDIVIFTQNFYLLKKASFNNIHALSTLIQSTENPSFQGVLQDVLAGVEAGEYMYTTMEYYDDIFPYIYINLIKVGELSGSLTESLQQSVRYLDESNDLTKKLKGILIPNIVQFILLFAILVAASTFIVPVIEGVYAEVGSTATLPGITIWFSNVLKALSKIWYIPVAVIALIAGLLFAYCNSPTGKYYYHLFKYRMPVFGNLIFSMDFSRFSKAMLLNLQNGMRIQEALDVSKNVVKNYVFLSLVETSMSNLILGESWIEPFEKSQLPSPMVTEMLKIGMQTDLPEMMDKLVEYMDMDIKNILDKITKILPQIMMSIVGIMIIFIVVVVIVPCIQVYMGNFLFDAAGV